MNFDINMLIGILPSILLALLLLTFWLSPAKVEVYPNNTFTPSFSPDFNPTLNVTPYLNTTLNATIALGTLNVTTSNLTIITQTITIQQINNTYICNNTLNDTNTSFCWKP